MSGLLDGLLHTLRTLARRPAFTAATVFTLALGIGGAATMHGFLRAAMTYGRPTLPEPERVARLHAALPGSEARGPVRWADYRRWSEAGRSFEALAAYAQRTDRLQSADGGEEVQVLRVTPSYLAVLQTPPLLGRRFTEADSRTGGGRVALLSERAWRSRFGADPGILDRSLVVDEEPYAIVGVLPEQFGLVMPPTDLFVPLRQERPDATVMVVGRRRGDLSWEQVGSEMNAVGFAEPTSEQRVSVRPILEDVRFRSRALWLVAVGPALVVLLVGCGNVACLLLVRAVRREREIAVRLALGATRMRLAFQLLVEGWVIAAAAGVFGLALASIGLRSARALLPPSVDLTLDLDGRGVLFGVLAAAATPLVFATAPLLHSLRVSLDGALRASLQKPLVGVGRYQLRDLFAILEVSLSVGLVALALVFLSLFDAMSSLELGFDPAGLVVATVRAPEGGAEAEPVVSEITLQRILDRVGALPGVGQVTVGEPSYTGSPVQVGLAPKEMATRALLARVGPDYFDTLQLPIVQGGAFGDSSWSRGTDSVVVSARLASHLWPATSPLGEVIYLSGSEGPEPLTVVGVSQDAVHLGRLAGLGDLLEFRYALYRLRSPTAPVRFDVVARVSGRPTSLFGPIRDAVASAEPRARLDGVSAVAVTFDASGGRAAPGLIHVIGGFGGLALALAAIGVFAVMSQLVDERRVELGLRLALGASPAGLVGLVVREGLIRVGIGSALGLAVLVAGVRTGFAGLLTVAGGDPWLWLGVAGTVGFAASAASYVPARRTTRLDPMVALRSE